MTEDEKSAEIERLLAEYQPTLKAHLTVILARKRRCEEKLAEYLKEVYQTD